ncbi:MAG: carboxypeptidase-like regulatory domain-containing protein [Candidatus Pedobacter colombiensis]|uniref:Carboxypeptidase-like regulatory domain-containing protein n=1 Tax=Candidatus Pedobacter colombiensis TaxID=3121371 RepID=A0AAJ5W7Z1_9SPHI|nr:carboxypeptidase-like regulatory domain-containing protein [Pedobacter sp.]WEK19761.1 MAG: carboxypeptidase-like regulatory domain-containing protein [Pedobacter sp.]
MRFIKFAIALILLSTAVQFSAFAQQDSIVLDNILKKTKKLNDERPIEKVYLHFDKPYYSVADTMWFKAYLTMEQNLPSLLSKIVYVDVINNKDSLVQTIKLPVVGGVASGNIPLTPGTYQQGNYYVKAYTVWMLNFSEDYFFSKTIPIGEAIEKQVNTLLSYKTTETDKTQVIDAVIQFKNRDNVIQANKTVNWRVLSNYDVVAKGKGTTDLNGFLRIKIDPRKSDKIKEGELITDINMTDKDIVTSSFKLKPTTAAAYDVQFFPEGGELVAGIASRIGFKAINGNGAGIDLKGSIVDNNGTKLIDFSSTHLGMGSFYMNAETGKAYKANVTFNDGTTKSFDLPKTLESGIVAQVNNTDSLTFNLKIVANGPYFEANKNKNLFIVATNGTMVYYAAKTKLINQVTAAKIPKDKFPEGIVQITLFSETGEPISERLAFNYQPNGIKLSLKTDLPTYKPRQKVKLAVTAKNATQFADGNFSIAVTDEQKVPVDENSEITILSSLLLTSDLKGYVEKPNYYFNKTNAKKLADLDVLLLTQGFRRYAYKEIIEGKFPPVSFIPEQSMVLTGTLRDRTGMPVRKGNLRLTVPGTRIGVETITSPSGIFAFQNLNFPDSSEVVISAKYNPNGNNLMVLLDGQPSPQITKNPYPAQEVTNIDSTLSAYLNNSKRQYSYLRQLKEVKIEGAKAKRPSHADYPALAGLSSISGTLIEGDRFKDCNMLTMCLQTMATGLIFYENNFYVNRDYQQGSRVPVQIFLNGMPIDYFGLASVQSADVENVEVFTKDELGTVNRMYNTNGVLVINTKKAPKGTKMSMEEFKKLIPDPSVLKIRPKGFSKQREFYSPKYVNAAATYNFNDLRSTIYWNPNVITTAAGGLSLEYYNADGKGTYKAVIEGVDKNGNIGRFVYRYTVK